MLSRNDRFIAAWLIDQRECQKFFSARKLRRHPPARTPTHYADSTPFGDNDFEVFAWDNQRAVLSEVELVEQQMEIGLKRLTCLRIDRRERLDDRAVVIAENFESVFGRLVAKDKVPEFAGDGCIWTEQADDMDLATL